ncbi:anti-sigma-D factor RsdA [Nocardia australiensis]|uniref:anti-sigma-D factor RsdA n=1 Tax=Nocardia australiensis TaxID=2887191 RepID=UPI001D1437B0|nr:anti-sigma-D factor RsdA [Nocardia australiensis]
MARDGKRGRGDWKARLGSRSDGPYAEGAGDTGPVDIAAVRRDDALIDAIAGDEQVQTDSAEELQLAALLANWRAELVAEAMPEEPILDEIVAAVNQEIGARQVRVGAQTGGRLRLLRPIMGTAAAVALVIGGMTAFSYNAEPGDPLWRVKEVVFSEQAQTTVVQRASDDLTSAEQLIVAGNPELAKAKLDGARQNVSQIDDTKKQDDLSARWTAVVDQLRKVAPDIASSITQTPPRTTEPKPSGSSEGNAPVTPKPGGDSSTVPTVMGVPGVPSTTPPPGETTTPGKPTTTEPPTTPGTSEPTTPSQHPTTTATPTTVASPTVVEPTGDTGLPTEPVTRPSVPESNPGSIVPTGSVPGT